MPRDHRLARKTSPPAKGCPFHQKKNASAMGTYFAKHFKAGGMPSWPYHAGKITTDAGKRDNAWKFPSLAECRAVFDQATGTSTDWPDAAGDAVHSTAA